jgi:hypothetical protein
MEEGALPAILGIPIIMAHCNVTKKTPNASALIIETGTGCD